MDRTPEPRTRLSLAADLRQLGLEPGALVIVHSSLSSLGWVCGGSEAVVLALMDVLTESGTLVVPTLGMGRIPETFRSWPEALRSSHPAFSFAAWGRHASLVTGDHSLDYSLGEDSPLARIYELDGQVLLLGWATKAIPRFIWPSTGFPQFGRVRMERL